MASVNTLLSARVGKRSCLVTEALVHYDLLDGERAGPLLPELSNLFRQVYAEPPYSLTDEDVSIFQDSYRRQVRHERFALVTATADRHLVGFAFGLPLSPDTSWWSSLLTPLPADVTDEWPGRTFALIEFGVVKAWRRRGIGKALHDRLLQSRSEQRATLTVLPDASAAQAAYARLGWHKVAQTRNPLPGDPIFDVLLKQLDSDGRQAPLGRLWVR